MAGEANVFPAFIRAQFEPGNAFAEFVTQSDTAGRAARDQLERHFRGAADEIARITQRALTMPRNASGALDLGVGEMRQAAQAAEERAAALRQVATAAQGLAARETQLSGAQQAQIAATVAAATAAERDALKKREQVAILDQLQTELNQTAAATGLLTTAQQTAAGTAQRFNSSVGQMRAGSMMLGQQIQDVSMQLALGTDPLRVFAMQAGQTALAVQMMGGAGSRFAAFLGGPWGAAILGAVSLVGLFATRSKEAETAQINLANAADTLGQAQGLLGGMFDLATGKLLNQNEVVREAIRLQAVLAQLEADRAGQQAGARLGAMRANAYLDERGRGVSAGDVARFGGEFGSGEQVLGDTIRANPGAQAFERLVAGFRANRDASVTEFRRALEGMANRGELPGIDINGALREAITVATNRNLIRDMRGVVQAAETGALPSFLRRPQTGGGSRTGGRDRQPADQAEFGEDTGRRIADIAARFEDTPRQVEAVNQAMRQLDDIASDLERRRPPNYEALNAQLEEAKTKVREGLLQPYQQFLAQHDAQREIQALINAGRDEEAETLSTIMGLEAQVGKLTEGQREAIARRIELRAEEQRQAERARQTQAQYLDALQDVRSSLESVLTNLNTRGLRSLGDFAGGLQATFEQLGSAFIVENIFGDMFRDVEDFVTGRGRVRQANERMATASDQAKTAIEGLAAAATGATQVFRDKIAGQAANDDEKPIVITARPIRGPAEPDFALDPRTFTRQLVSGLLGEMFGARLAETLSQAVTKGMEGAAIGGAVGGIAQSIGVGNSGFGSQIGGALGNVLGEQFLNGIGKSLGIAGGPLGSIVGGLAGSLLGGVFGSPPRAATTIGGSGGDLIASTTGTRSLRGQTSTAGDSVISTLNRIAEILGGSVNAAAGSVSIGVRNGSYRVDPSGRGRTKTSKGAIDFGEDAEAAIRAAVLDMIQDGVIAGLRQGTQRLLQMAKDIDSGIEKALKFESVFVRLKEHIDPVGAALDAVNKEFDQLRRIFQEAGASAADLASLEQLYAIEREKALKGSGERSLSALRSLLDDLTVGNESFSIRERFAQARAKYDPLAADLAAGKAVDYDAFADAARMVNDISRQIYGSTSPYFQVVDEITGLTKRALEFEENRTPDASAPVVGAIDHLGSHLGGILTDQIGGRLDALNDNVGTLIQLSMAGGGARSEAPSLSHVHNF
jgi:hypothetical protein